MKKKHISYSQLPLSQKKLVLHDVATAAAYGSLPADRRIHLSMPGFLVDELDALYPHKNRNELFTEILVELIAKKYQYQHSPELAALAKDEQGSLDTLWNYLAERDAR
jgi:hypothetical protein